MGSTRARTDPAATAASVDPGGSLDPAARARLDESLEAALARIRVRDAEDEARRVLWRTHHWPDQYERCAVVAGHRVCRRCLVLYPLALVVAALSAAGIAPWPAHLDTWFVWASAVPATVEFVAEQLGAVAHRPRRQVAVTAVLALGVGRGFAHELAGRWSPVFWGPVAVGCTIWFVAALIGRRRARARPDAAAPDPSPDTVIRR